jgi:hypothetical protein
VPADTKDVPWLMMVLLDADVICARPGVLFCPGNSAYNDYPVVDILEMQGIEAFDALDVKTFCSSEIVLSSEAKLPVSA